MIATPETDGGAASAPTPNETSLNALNSNDNSVQGEVEVNKQGASVIPFPKEAKLQDRHKVALLSAEPDYLRLHIEMIHRLATPYTGRGLIRGSGFGQDPDVQPEIKDGKTVYPSLSPRNAGFGIGDIGATEKFIATLREEPHYNTYMPLAVMRPNLPDNAKGGEDDVVAVLGLVADFDDADAGNWEKRLPVKANYVLETSPGRFQVFFLFDEPQAVQAAKVLAKKLKGFSRCDHCTSDVSHVWRVPGCRNWPNRKKVHLDGRDREPQQVKVLVEWDGSRTSVEALEKALEHVTVAEEVTVEPIEDVRSDFNPLHHVGRSNSKINALINAPAQVGERSEQFYAQVLVLADRHLTDGEIALVLQTNSNGAWTKYKGRLLREVARARANQKAEEAATATTVQKLEAQYVYVADIRRFVDPEEPKVPLQKEAINELYSHERNNMADELLRRRTFRKAITTDYVPGKGLIAGNALNLWRPSGLEPVQGDVSPFLNHMALLIPTGRDRDHVLDFMAFMVQRPGVKIRHAILIQGASRVGKSLLSDVMRPMIGRVTPSRCGTTISPAGSTVGWRVKHSHTSMN